MNLGYRADIDGLRALAVLSVILFHLDIAIFPGGYVGVDVFFVISGFLISRIMHDEIRDGTFSFANFYERRARRIFPSLIATLLLSIIGAALVLSTDDMASFGKELMSTLLFVSNIYFWQNIGYFTADVHAKPLLHMWSLSVEEQFYFVWPLLMVFLMRKTSTRITLLVIALLFLASLAAAEFTLREDTNAVFYLLPFRIFEFLIGAALVWIIKRPRKWRISNELLVVIGLGMIGYSVHTFTNQTPFPSAYALIPCIGAALIIYAGAGGYARLILANPVANFIGKISYELYLVHWPLIVCFYYLLGDGVMDTHRAIIAALTFVIAVALYYGVGRPLRRVKDHHAALNFLIGCATVAVLIALTCIWVLRIDYGWKWRIDEKYRALITDFELYSRSQFGGSDFKTNTVIDLGNPTIPASFFIFGDSYATQYASGLAKILKENGKNAKAMFYPACMMMPNITSYLSGQPNGDCAKKYPEVREALQGSTMPVVIAQSWHTYQKLLGNISDGQILSFTDDNAYYAKILETVEVVRQELGENRKIILVAVLPGAKNQKNISRCFKVPKVFANDCASSMTVDRATETIGNYVNGLLKDYASRHPNVFVLDPYEAFCDATRCRAMDQNIAYYSDGSHLSIDGSIYFAEHFKDFFLNIDQVAPVTPITPAPEVKP